MAAEGIERLASALEETADLDLPADREAFAALVRFLVANPEFDPAADGATDELAATARGSGSLDVPDDTHVDRLASLLYRHDDVDVLARLLRADDPAAVLDDLDDGDGPRGSGPR